MTDERKVYKNLKLHQSDVRLNLKVEESHQERMSQ